jgi:hypothetical protein
MGNGIRKNFNLACFRRVTGRNSVPASHDDGTQALRNKEVGQHAFDRTPSGISPEASYLNVSARARCGEYCPKSLARPLAILRVDKVQRRTASDVLRLISQKARAGT